MIAKTSPTLTPLLRRLPVAWKPHAYQLRAVRFILRNSGAGLLLSPGLGKTSVVLAAIRALKKAGVFKAALVIAPLRPCYQVWPKEVEKWTEFRDLKVEILHGPKKDEALKRKADIYVINPEGLPWLFASPSYKKLRPCTLVCDECFVDGTKVRTPTGYRNISSLKVGELIQNDMGAQRIARVSCNRVSSENICEVTFENGEKITCTKTHPFFTDSGWVAAVHLKGRRVLRSSEVSNVRECLSGSFAFLRDRLSHNLLAILRSQAGLDRERQVARDYAESDARHAYGQTILEQWRPLSRSYQIKIVRMARAIWNVAVCGATGRKWETYAARRSSSFPSFTGELYQQLCNSVGREAAWLSYKLQSRLWQSEAKNRDRSGWLKPFFIKAPRNGQEERKKIKGARVAYVTDIERCRFQDVWNLEIEGVHQRFAVGSDFLVHNSTLFKHSSTRRFKLLKPELGKFSRRWILTGTPAPNGLMDLFGQIFIVDLGKALGPYITHYRQEFFSPVGFEGYNWELKKGANKQIYARIKPITLRLDADDYLDLPELLGWDAPIYVELPPKARKIYDDMEELMVAELEAGKYETAINAASALIKCGQIANGGLYRYERGDEENFDFTKPIKRTWTDLHNEKIEAVKELLESIQGHQALIVYDFKHDLARLRAALGKDVPYIGGGVSAKRGEELEALWNAQKIPALLVHPQSVGHGLNLQTGGDYIIWHSLTWNNELWDQLNSRLRRQGSIHKHIFAYPIIARDTVDEAKYYALNNKTKNQKALLDSLRVYVKSRKR